MTARTRRRYRVTLMALCCMLLAHWSLLVHACPTIQRAAALVAQGELAASSAADCHGGAPALADDEEAPSTLCWKHCADEGEASNGNGLAFGAAAAPPRVMRLQVATVRGPLHWQQAPACSDATAPPLSILYCVSRT
jgi:hypothetical protein